MKSLYFDDTTRRQRVLWGWVLVLVLALGLAGCGDSSTSDTTSEAPVEQSEQTEQTQATPASVERKPAVGGSPWVNSNEGGNLPIEQPEPKDDLYQYTNYDYIADHQLTGGNPQTITQEEIKNATITAIEDTSRKDPELEQLRIFYSQLSDLDARAKTGVSELMPYYDRIMAVSSIEELNELLAADDYPFVPFLNTYVGTNDMHGNNLVGITPKFVLTDGAIGGAEYYQDTEDENAKNLQAVVMLPEVLKTASTFVAFGVATDQEAAATLAQNHRDFEASYGKYGDYTGLWASAEYGEYGKANQTFTLAELQERCPNMPIAELLSKVGRDESEAYVLSAPTWLFELDKLWTEDNLESIKTAVFLSMTKDCFPILDPSLYKVNYATQGVDSSDASACAYASCNTLNTMSNVIAKIYVNDVLGTTAKERLTKLTDDIVQSYRELFQETTWMSDTAKKNAIDKLDHMSLNILEPAGGYLDYSKLELTPTDKGGTLLGNLLALMKYRTSCENELLGQPAKAVGSWFLIRPTEMNCFYEPFTNSINIFPGFVTSYVYTDSASDQELLAGIGSVIGHEISHGFDYLGSQYDAYGTGNPIFSGSDAKAFIERRQKLVDYFDTIQVSEGVYVNGENKSIEGAADLCGVQSILATAKKMDNVDYKKFFEDYARLWCQVLPPGSTLAVGTESHPLNYLRANAMVQMYDEFYDAYGIVEGNGMYLAPSSRIIMWGPNA